MEPQGIALPVTAYQSDRSDDLAAFERIMVRCERRVLRIALRLLNNPQDAQDAAQEVFLRLYKQLGRLDLNDARGCEPWLFRVTVNVCHDMARKRGHSVALEDVAFEDAPAVRPTRNTAWSTRSNSNSSGARSAAWARRSVPPWCCATWKGYRRGK